MLSRLWGWWCVGTPQPEPPPACSHHWEWSPAAQTPEMYGPPVTCPRCGAQKSWYQQVPQSATNDTGGNA